MYRTWWDCPPGAQARGFGRTERRSSARSDGRRSSLRSSLLELQLGVFKARFRPVPSRSSPFRPVPSRPVLVPSRLVPSRNPASAGLLLSNTTWFGRSRPNNRCILGFPALEGPESGYPTLPRFRVRDGTGTGRDGYGAGSRKQGAGSREHRPYGPVTVLLRPVGPVVD